MTRPVAGRAPARRGRPGARTPDLAVRLRECQRTMRPRLTTRSALAHVLQSTHATLDPRRVAEFLVSWAPTWWPVPVWAVVTADVDGQIALLASHGLTESLAPVAQAVGGRVLHGTEDFASRDLSHDARVPGPTPAVAAVGFLLRGRDGAIGALVGLDRKPSAADLPMVPGVQKAWSALLGPAALALENALIVERAEALSVTDDLTRLYNSRYLNQSLRRETKRAVRTGRALSLLFIDLDGFKAVNDTYGHLYGSRALVEAAAVIRSSARETDVVARFGGDEFSLILPDTGREGAMSVAARIQERIRSAVFLAADGLSVHLTVSIGVATLPDVAASAEELLRAADVAMYRVKASGKDGIYFATTT